MLKRTAKRAIPDLTSQARLTRDCSSNLMRVRLVPFSNVSERLYRVARQVAKELDKRVSLDIRGGNTEIDRGVLEKMAAPIEHLLRNAIAHGLEVPRRASRCGQAGDGRADARRAPGRQRNYRRLQRRRRRLAILNASRRARSSVD